MIVVSGASGQLGRRTIEYLRERTDAARVIALTRTPAKVADLGVTARQGDFDDPAGLVSALDGAQRLLIISTDVLDPTGTRIRQQTSAVQAAAKAGVEHVLYTSFVHATDAGNPAFVAPDHAATEQALAEAGVAFTLLRENVYTDTLLATAPGAVASGMLTSNNGDGRVAYVARDDIAAVAAALLAEGGYEGQTLDLTGPAALTQAEVAQALSDVTGVPVRHQPLTDHGAVAGMVQYAGMPQFLAEAYATFGRAARDGWLAGVSDVVARVAGRRPTSVAEFFAAHRSYLLS